MLEIRAGQTGLLTSHYLMPKGKDQSGERKKSFSPFFLFSFPTSVGETPSAKILLRTCFHGRGQQSFTNWSAKASLATGANGAAALRKSYGPLPPEGSQPGRHLAIPGRSHDGR